MDEIAALRLEHAKQHGARMVAHAHTNRSDRRGKQRVARQGKVLRDAGLDTIVCRSRRLSLFFSVAAACVDAGAGFGTQARSRNNTGELWSEQLALRSAIRGCDHAILYGPVYGTKLLARRRRPCN